MKMIPLPGKRPRSHKREARNGRECPNANDPTDGRPITTETEHMGLYPAPGSQRWRTRDAGSGTPRSTSHRHAGPAGRGRAGMDHVAAVVRAPGQLSPDSLEVRQPRARVEAVGGRFPDRAGGLDADTPAGKPDGGPGLALLLWGQAVVRESSEA